MEDLLPIVLGIIYLAYRQYKKSTKDNLEPAVARDAKTTHEESAAKEEIGDFMRQYFGEDNYAFDSVESPDLPSERAANDEEMEKISENKQEQVYSIEYDKNIGSQEQEKEQFEIIKNKEKKTVEDTDFDLRKAVVYDAVLNPPYIEN